MNTGTTWYYLEDSRQVGPYTREELETLFERGAILADTLVWTKDRSWAPMGGIAEASPEATPGKQRRAWILLITAALFCGGLSYQAEFPVPSSAKDNSALLVSPEVSNEVTENSDAASLPTQEEELPMEEELPRPASAGNQLVQEYWRAIAHSKVIGRYEYYLRRSPSGSFAAGAAERIKDLSSEALTEKPKAKPRKKAETVAKDSSRLKKARPDPASAAVAKKIDGRCWSRNMEACRERCRSGEKLACQKLVRLGD
jgi:uncharacterized protein DUF4339